MENERDKLLEQNQKQKVDIGKANTNPERLLMQKQQDENKRLKDKIAKDEEERK